MGSKAYERSEAGRAKRAARNATPEGKAKLAAYRSRTNAKRYKRHAEYVETICRSTGCADCGTHEGRLLFHHIDPDSKVRNVTQMANRSRAAIDAEIAKCVVLCYQCHSDRHQSGNLA